jgi:hypothetical protein
MVATTSPPTLSLLKELLARPAASLTEEQRDECMAWDLSEEERLEIRYLCEQNGTGDITPAEKARLTHWVDYIDSLSLLQLRIRVARRKGI